jgi:hypothetical protein
MSSNSISGFSTQPSQTPPAKATFNMASLQSDAQQGTAGDSLSLLQMNEEFMKNPPPLSSGPTMSSASQLYQLKAQILAFRFLARNLTLPPNLLAAIRGMNPLVSILCNFY